MKSLTYILAIFLLLISFREFSAQNRSETLKRQAMQLMQDGRYGEAIDLLNKYVTANPRIAEGYNLRGLCFEKSIQYQYAVLDFRRAIKLDPNNSEIQRNLDRVIKIWHQILYKQIEGYKREIAINPDNPFNYLEIGKDYRWLELWKLAENWYDEYLKRDDNASPDEIIRYTEILAKTGSILKGERILKKYVDRYPEDWRLWSRYGYFTLWLGKYRIAENAFSTSLGFKPFFKEAEDGLDLAKKQGYLTQYVPRSFESVYPIDRYYSLLKRNPDDNEVRYELIKELIKAKRYEEAYQQLQLVPPNLADESKFSDLKNEVVTIRDSLNQMTVDSMTVKLKEDPSDKKAVLKLAESYGNLYLYDNALEVLGEYLQDKSETDDPDVRFQYAKYAAWNYEWEKAIEQLNILMKQDPDNLDYQLLRAQISVWTVLDLDQAKVYLTNVLDKRPDNLDAILAMASLLGWQRDFDAAKVYIDKAQSIAPNDPNVINAASNYALHLSAYQQVKNLELRAEAGKLSMEGQCDEALAKYDEYLTKITAPTREEKIEYAQINLCAKQYGKAIDIYDSLLTEQYDTTLALERAKALLGNGDTTQAVSELEKLYQSDPSASDIELYLADAYTQTGDFDKAEKLYDRYRSHAESAEDLRSLNERYLYLGDALVKAGQYKRAEKIYDMVREEANDTSEIRKVNQRYLYLGDTMLQNNDKENAEDLFNRTKPELRDTSLIRLINTRYVFLGDAYVKEKRYGDAEDMYDRALEGTSDTAQARIIKQRIGWLPPYGFGAGAASFGRAFLYLLPTNMGLAPLGTFYTDNQDLRFYSYGGRFEGGFANFLSAGVSYLRTNIHSSTADQDLTAFKGMLTIIFSRYFTIGGSYGKLTPQYELSKNIWDITARYFKKDTLELTAYYENNDARLLLYSPNLLYIRLKSELYRFNGMYQYKDLVRLSGHYSYIKVEDGNEGNDFQIRVGKRFFEKGFVGYEYYFSDYAFISYFYYSPQNFESHSLWAEWKDKLENNLDLTIGGKIGYVPASDFIISELSGEAVYKPFPYLNISGRLSYGNSFRYDSSYKFFSASLNAYLSIY